MDSTEFFKILRDSNLDQAYGWYYDNMLYWLVPVFSLLCVLVLIWYAWNKTDGTRILGLRVCLRREELVRPFDTAFMATLGLLGIVATVMIRRNPMWLIHTLDPTVTSLYDLTPQGIQFVIDILQVSAVMAVITAVFLGATALAAIWLEFLTIKSADSMMGTYSDGRITLPLQTKAWIMIFAGTVAFVVALFSTFLGQWLPRSAAASKLSEPNMPACSASTYPEVVYQRWQESPTGLSAPALAVTLRFVTANGDPKTQPPDSLFFQIGDATSEMHDPRTRPELDPLDVVILPEFDRELEEDEIKYAALATEQFLSNFEIKGSKLEDRAYLFVTGKDAFIGSEIATVWPRGTANEIFLNGASIAHGPLDLGSEISDILSRWPERPVSETQDTPQRLIIVLRWLRPDHGTQTTPIPMTLKQLAENVDGQADLWMVEFVSGVPREIDENKNASRIKSFAIPVPSRLVNDDLSYNLAALPNALYNQKVKETIDEFRSAFLYEFELERVLAAREITSIRAWESDSCYWDLTEAFRDQPPQTGNANDLPLLTMVFLAALFSLTTLFPIGLTATIVLRILKS